MSVLNLEYTDHFGHVHYYLIYHVLLAYNISYSCSRSKGWLTELPDLDNMTPSPSGLGMPRRFVNLSQPDCKR